MGQPLRVAGSGSDLDCIVAASGENDLGFWRRKKAPMSSISWRSCGAVRRGLLDELFGEVHCILDILRCDVLREPLRLRGYALRSRIGGEVWQG